MTFFVAQRLTLCALLAAACVSDMKTDRIPNRLCLAGCLSGLCLNAIFSGGSGVLFSFAGLLIPVVTLFLLFHFRVIGAGDIKLLSAVGSVVGLQVGRVIVFSFAVCACFAVPVVIVNLIRKRYRFTRVHFSLYVALGSALAMVIG